MKRLFALLFLLFASSAQAQSPLGMNLSCTGPLVQTCQMKPAGGQLWFLQATTTAASWVFVVDTTTAPVNGAIVPTLHWNVGTGTVTSVFDSSPILFQNGIYAACSSSAPPTLTLASTCIFTFSTR